MPRIWCNLRDDTSFTCIIQGLILKFHTNSAMNETQFMAPMCEHRKGKDLLALFSDLLSFNNPYPPLLPTLSATPPISAAPTESPAPRNWAVDSLGGSSSSWSFQKHIWKTLSIILVLMSRKVGNLSLKKSVCGIFWFKWMKVTYCLFKVFYQHGLLGKESEIIIC